MTSGSTADTGIEETSLLSPEEKNAVELNNSNNNSKNDNNSGPDNYSSSGGNESRNNNSAPGFGLLEGLTCLYGERRLRKK
ncbi:hypothetical protein [Methanosarcina horonobensis]|uniref:hypothetical protein n=1 Tax=Methanosarcina horonobensis TaxID=418008 RepID=UPI002FCDE964